MTCKECYHNEVCEALYELNGVPRIFACQCAYFRNAADVVEVRHGEWRIVDSDLGYVELECSLCRNKLLFNTDDGFTYCPKCGAKMDGKRRVDNEG